MEAVAVHVCRWRLARLADIIDSPAAERTGTLASSQAVHAYRAKARIHRRIARNTHLAPQRAHRLALGNFWRGGVMGHRLFWLRPGTGGFPGIVRGRDTQRCDGRS